MSFELLGVKIDDLSTEDLMKTFESWLLGDKAKMIVTPNAEMILAARRERDFRELLNHADLSLPDSVSLRYAAAAFGERLQHRHPGVDAAYQLAELCEKHNKHLILFGGDPGSAQAAADKLNKLFPSLKATAIDPGYIKFEGQGIFDEKYFNELKLHTPEVLVVALGHRKQEAFSAAATEKIESLKIVIGVGGSLEMIAEVLPRAPRIIRRIGLEWFWRPFLESRRSKRQEQKYEPKRWQRVFDAVFLFPAAVVYDTLKCGIFFRACFRVIPEVFRQLIGK